MTRAVGISGPRSADPCNLGQAKATTTRQVGADGRAVVTDLPTGSQVSVFTAKGLHVTVSVGVNGRSSFTAADALRVAVAVATLD